MTREQFDYGLSVKELAKVLYKHYNEPRESSHTYHTLSNGSTLSVGFGGSSYSHPDGYLVETLEFSFCDSGSTLKFRIGGYTPFSMELCEDTLKRVFQSMGFKVNLDIRRIMNERCNQP